MLLVDCYNVLHVNMPPSLAGLDEAGLCRLLGSHPWAMQFGKIVVVADGRPKPGRAASSPVDNVTLRFSGRTKTADDIIIELIKKESAPRAITVVSTDREIRHAARARRAAVMTSEAVIRELSKRSIRRGGSAQERPDVSDPLPSSLVDHWMKRFNVDAGALGAPQSPAEVLSRPKPEPTRTKKSTYRRLREAEPTPPEPPPEAPSEAPPKRGRASEAMRENGVSSQDADYWIKEFGLESTPHSSGEEAAVRTVATTKTLKAPPPKKSLPSPKKEEPTRRVMTTKKAGEALDRVSDTDIDAWLRVFGLTPEDGKE